VAGLGIILIFVGVIAITAIITGCGVYFHMIGKYDHDMEMMHYLLEDQIVKNMENKKDG